MADKPEQTGFDPFEAWRNLRDASMDAWAKAMVQTVNTEAYAKASGAMLDNYLTATAPFREIMEKATAQALQQMNLPSREEVAGIAQRLTNIEMRLDDLDAKLDSILDRATAAGRAGETAGEVK